MTLDRDAAANEALLTDLYLDALLADAVLDEPDGPRLDPAARSAADRLRRDLVRIHPSFRFEERLATKLAEAAVAMRVPIAVGAEGRVVAFRPSTNDDLGPDAVGPDDLTAAPSSDQVDVARRAGGRPLLIGGALTSAALSLAGAAWVAWHRGRPVRIDPMARAARAVREAKLAAKPPRTLD